MAAREARILELDEELQRIMNAPYLVRNDVTKMRFVAGKGVACCCAMLADVSVEAGWCHVISEQPGGRGR